MKIFRIEIEDKFEADMFSAMLEEEGVPYTLVNHFSIAYGSIFQTTTGWGHIEVPVEYKDKAIELLKNYRKSAE